MTAFHTIAVPHEDILAGRLALDVFAGEVSDLTRLYVLWRYGQARVPFDEARKLAQSCGVRKKHLDGFLAGRERVREEVAQTARQGRLFE